MIYYHSHPVSEAYPSRRDKDYAKLSKIQYIIFSHRFYPEPPYARVFLVHDDDTVTEGRIEIV
jgi:proteasome lid subunit RPN8/RPN11